MDCASRFREDAIPGNERRDMFREERDREHSLELLGELPERFGVLLHG